MQQNVFQIGKATAYQRNQHKYQHIALSSCHSAEISHKCKDVDRLSRELICMNQSITGYNIFSPYTRITYAVNAAVERGQLMDEWRLAEGSFGDLGS